MNYKSLKHIAMQTFKSANIKLFILVFTFLAAHSGFAQEENEMKNFRFGLKAAPSLNWFKPDDKKKFESDGVKFKFAYGLMTEFRLSSVAVFATGIQVDYDGGKLAFLDTSVYYFMADDEFIPVENVSEKAQAVDAQYRLKSREYKTTYVTLPLTLKMKTKEIGYLTYFGQFGLNTSFKMKSRADDEVVIVKTNAPVEQSDLDNGKDMNLLKFALNVGAGAEYGLSGSTAIVFGINYYNGFSSVIKPTSKFLQRGRGTGVNEGIKQKATSNAVALTVGILF